MILEAPLVLEVAIAFFGSFVRFRWGGGGWAVTVTALLAGIDAGVWVLCAVAHTFHRKRIYHKKPSWM